MTLSIASALYIRIITTGATEPYATVNAAFLDDLSCTHLAAAVTSPLVFVIPLLFLLVHVG
jgi:hypothetical protein